MTSAPKSFAGNGLENPSCWWTKWSKVREPTLRCGCSIGPDESTISLREKRPCITYENVYKALTTDNVSFDDTQVFIRDSFDHYFDRIEEVEHFINIKLILFEDIQDTQIYYVVRLRRNKSVFETFMLDYGYDGALKFFERYKIWNEVD